MSQINKMPALAAALEWNTLKDIDETKSFAVLKLENELSQDLLLGKYSNGLLLSVDWADKTSYGTLFSKAENHDRGVLVVTIIREQDWDQPVLTWEARSFDELWEILRIVDKWAVHVDPQIKA